MVNSLLDPRKLNKAKEISRMRPNKLYGSQGWNPAVLMVQLTPPLCVCNTLIYFHTVTTDQDDVTE